MNLFLTNQILHSANENPLKLKTPLGDIVFEVNINHLCLDVVSLSKNEATEANSLLSCWNTKNCIINCLRVNFDPILPPNQEVDKSYAIIWRIKASENLNIALNCFLKTSLVSFPETGEFLISQSFENKLLKLSIGTEDEEKLEYRARNNDWVPNRFESEVNADNIRYLDNGIGINFPLFKDEQIQIQFIIAWSSKKERELSTWFAVEQSSIEILRQTGFY